MYDEAPAPESGLTLDTLLQAAGLTSEGLVLLGHAPAETELRRVLPWLAQDRPQLFDDYQAIQSGVAALTTRRARRLASFIKTSPNAALFAGFCEIQGSEALAPETFWEAPGLAEMKELGYRGADQNGSRPTRLQLLRTPLWANWIGKLAISWPPARLIARRADNARFEVLAIHEESHFASAMPDWKTLAVGWTELDVLPPSWRSALAQWRGVYFIFDAVRRAGYVGSAAGSDNLLGRWRNYAQTGHGGNRRLRESRPEDLRFSILQLTSPDLPRDEVVALETCWKARLHTRQFGLNAN